MVFVPQAMLILQSWGQVTWAISSHSLWVSYVQYDYILNSNVVPYKIHTK